MPLYILRLNTGNNAGRDADSVIDIMPDCLFVQLGKVALASAVEAHRLNMNCTYRYHLGAVFLIEIVKVGLVLEVVGVNLTVVYNIVGLYIIGYLYYIKVYFLF